MTHSKIPNPHAYMHVPNTTLVKLVIVIFFLFQKKKQKALFCFAEDSIRSKRAWRSLAQNSAKPTQGVWGLAPKKTNLRVVILFFFQKKKQKALLIPLCGRLNSFKNSVEVFSPNLGEADPGVLGACPQEKQPG
jgi:hypothetical protein